MGERRVRDSVIGRRGGRIGFQPVRTGWKPILLQHPPQHLVVRLAGAEHRDLVELLHLVQPHHAAEAFRCSSALASRSVIGSVVNSTMRRPSGVSMPSTATRGPSSVGGYFFGERLLQRRQRDHLAAGLQEPLQPAVEDDRAGRVELREVAGDVPPLAVDLLERRRAVVTRGSRGTRSARRRAACPSCPAAAPPSSPGR